MNVKVNVKVNGEVDPRSRALQEVEVKVRGPRVTSSCSGKTSGCFLFAAPTGSGHNLTDFESRETLSKEQNGNSNGRVKIVNEGASWSPRNVVVIPFEAFGWFSQFPFQ